MKRTGADARTTGARTKATVTSGPRVEEVVVGQEVVDRLKSWCYV